MKRSQNSARDRGSGRQHAAHGARRSSSLPSCRSSYLDHELSPSRPEIARSETLTFPALPTMAARRSPIDYHRMPTPAKVSSNELRHSALANGIADVVEIRPKEEMRRPHALRIVTMMTYEHSPRDRTI